MSYEEQPANRLDARDQARKRQARINESMDWRSSNNNRLEDFDSNFKLITKAEKQRRESQIAQGVTKVTQQQIDERIARQEIIQRDVKAGTYHNPDKIYNKVNYDWVTHGDPETNAKLRRKSQP